MRLGLGLGLGNINRPTCTDYNWTHQIKGLKKKKKRKRKKDQGTEAACLPINLRKCCYFSESVRGRFHFPLVLDRYKVRKTSN